MRFAWICGIVLLLGRCLDASDAVAMEFRRVPLDGGQIIIVASGQIRDGDDRRLHEFAAGLSGTDKILGIALNSPGGSVVEAEKLVTTILNTKLGTLVVRGNVCASACFLLFAAGRQKVADEGALLGVHSANIRGAEGLDSLAATTLMARDAAALHVPAAIIGRMVTTTANDIAWLTPAELRSMGAVVVAPQRQADYQPGTPLITGTKPTAEASPPSGTADQPTTGTSVSFDQGLADRRAYEAWFGGLNADAKQGALFWATNRNRAAQGVGCDGPNLSWSETCRQAQVRLGAADRRRRAEPEYRAGWNSY
jgi:hypothetical protein